MRRRVSLSWGEATAFASQDSDKLTSRLGIVSEVCVQNAFHVSTLHKTKRHQENGIKKLKERDTHSVHPIR
jgi:hypothetical protein